MDNQPQTRRPQRKPRTLHVEIYRSTRSGDEIRVHCWCVIDRTHSYEEWLDAGRPSHTSKPVSKRRG